LRVREDMRLRLEECQEHTGVGNPNCSLEERALERNRAEVSLACLGYFPAIRELASVAHRTGSIRLQTIQL